MGEEVDLLGTELEPGESGEPADVVGGEPRTREDGTQNWKDLDGDAHQRPWPERGIPGWLVH